MKKNMPISGRERVCVQKWVNPIPAGLFLSMIGDGRFTPPIPYDFVHRGWMENTPPSRKRVRQKTPGSDQPCYHTLPRKIRFLFLMPSSARNTIQWNYPSFFNNIYIGKSLRILSKLKYVSWEHRLTQTAHSLPG